MYVYVYICVCMYVCMCVFEYIYTYIYIQVPTNFMCPISHSVMVNPAITPNGNSFDRLAIERSIDLNKKVSRLLKIIGLFCRTSSFF